MGDRLAGKVALITGGARGIGRTMTDMFVSEGASVVMAGRNEEAGALAESEIVGAGGRAKFVQTDVTERDALARAVEATVSQYGSLTILVNNAASSGEALEGGIAICDPEAWDLLIATDLTSVYNACHFAVPAMIESGGGSIISIGSTVAIHGQAHLPARIAAKLGVVGLMRSIAVDYGKDRIRANTIMPGVVPHGPYKFIAEEFGDLISPSLLLPFFGEPADVGHAAVYLASDEARWVTGSELVVGGGITRLPDILQAVTARMADQDV